MGTRPAALRSFEENHPLESNSAPVRVVNWCRPAGTWVYSRNRLAVEALPFAAGIPPKRTAGPLSLTQDRRALGTSATVKNDQGEKGLYSTKKETPPLTRTLKGNSASMKKQRGILISSSAISLLTGYLTRCSLLV